MAEGFKKPIFEVLHHDQDLIVIEKPPGFHVHQPEFPRRRVAKDVTCLPNLRDQIQMYVFPVHRLDVATEGALIFALNKGSAAELCRQFQTGVVKKTYYAIARGWAPQEQVIDIPLELDSTGIPVESVTRIRTVARVELPFAVGKRHASARYSLVEARPETGRFHQVRRHLARLSHPLIGDAVHGDSHHNRFFRTELDAPGLWLKAKSVEFLHPASGELIKIESKWTPRWKKIFSRLGWDEPERVT
jgi:tRNA pseudouridine65 synthase